MDRSIAERPTFAVLCILAVASTLVSGAIYPSYAWLFSAGVMLCFFLSMTGRSYHALAVNWPAFALAGLAYVSALWSVSLNLTLTQASYLSSFAIYAFIAAYSVKAGRRDTVLKLLVGAASVVSAYGIYQYYFGLAHTEEYLRAYGAEMGLPRGKVASAMLALEYRRAFSTMLSPNVLAGFIAMVFPAGLYLYGSSRTAQGRAMALSSLVLMAAAAVLTKSFGGLTALAAGTAVYMVARPAVTGDGRRRPGMALVAAVLIVCVAAGYFIVSSRTGGFFGVERSYTERINYFSGSLATFASSPVAGQGAGSFSVTYLRTIKPGGGETRYAHNLVLQTLSETGLIGLSAIAAIFIVFFSRCFRGVKRGEADASLYVALAAGGAAFLSHNMVDYTWYVHETAAVWWLFFGMAAGTVQVKGVNARVGAAVKLVATACVLAVCVIMVSAWVAAGYRDEAVGILREHGINDTTAARSGPVPGEALRLAGRAAALKPYDDTLRAFLAVLYEGAAYKAGPMSARLAVEQYGEAIRLNPLYPYHYRDLGILYLKLGRKEDARAEFRAALVRYPADRRLAAYLSGPEK